MSVNQQSAWTLQQIEEFAEELTSAYRSLLSGQQLAAAAHLRELLPVYSAELLPLVDRRIGECHALIKRGLRDEALGRANEPPDILRIANILDLDRFGVDEVARWKAASDVVGLVWPVPPRFDLLGDLIEAEAHVAELRPLLDKWRRLNLRHAPLPDRLAMLRKLLTQDALNDVWRDLLAVHERFRFTEIKAAIERLSEQVERPSAIDDESIGRELRSLLDELEADWTCEQPPEAIKRRAAQLEIRARERRIDKTLDKLVPELETAYAELADTLAPDRPLRLDYLRRLAGEWHSALRERGVIAQDDPRLNRAKPALDYVARLAEVDDLLLEVGQSVSQRPEQFKDRRAWSNDLDRSMDRVDAAVTGLAAVDIDVDRIAALSDRVARVAADVGREGWLRRFFVAGSAAAVVLTAGFLSWLTFDHRRHESLVAETVATLATEVDQLRQGIRRDVTTIERDWSARLRTDPRVSTAIDRVREEASTQEGRRDRFDQTFADIRKAITAVQQTQRPDPLAPWPADFAKASQSLDQLQQEGGAVTEQEKALLEAPAAALRVLATGYTQAADHTFIGRVKQLEQEIAAIEAVLLTDIGKADALLAECQKQCDGLVAISTTIACPNAAAPHAATRLVSSAAAAAVSPRSQVVNLLNQVRSQRGVYVGLDARDSKADELLTKGDLGEYADALREMATEIKEHPAGQDYLAVANHHPYWKALADWEALLPRIHAARHASSDEAAELRRVLADLSPELKALPFVNEVTTWLDPLLAETELCTKDRLALAADALKWLFEGQYGTMIDAVAWENDAPEPRALYYFLLLDRPLPDASRGAQAVIGWPSKGVWPKRNWTFRSATWTVADSPQKLVATRCLEILDRLPADNATVLSVDRVAAETLQCCAETPDGPAFDPCIHALLLRYVTLDICELSSFIKARMQRSLRYLEAGKTPEGQERQIRGVDNAAFTMILDPDAQQSRAVVLAARKVCSEFIASIRGEIKAVTQQLDLEEAALADRHATLIGYTCVGRLRRLAGGGWTVSGGTPERRKEQSLYVLERDATRVDMVPCAVCDAEGKIPAGTKVRGLAGQPVYVRLKIEEGR